MTKKEIKTVYQEAYGKPFPKGWRIRFWDERKNHYGHKMSLGYTEFISNTVWLRRDDPYIEFTAIHEFTHMHGRLNHTRNFDLEVHDTFYDFTINRAAKRIRWF